MKKIYTLIILTCLMTLRLMGIDPPRLQCISINPNSTCKITWDYPNSFVGIDHIEVWCKTSENGQFTWMASTESDSVGSTIFSIGDNVDDIYCYLKAYPANTSESVVYSDTMHNIKLTLNVSGSPTNPNNHNSIAHLIWNNPDPFPETCNNYNYNIYRKTSYDSDFRSIAQVNRNGNLEYRDYVDVCEDSIRYYVSILNNYDPLELPCQFKTRPKANLFSDGTAPNAPTLDSVSVNPVTQLIELGWTLNSPDAVGCIIYEVDNPSPGANSIDTVIGTHWVSSATGDILHQYRIAAIDSCFHQNSTASILTTAQNNIIVTVVGMDICQKKIKLQWNSYANMTGELGEYQIYYAQDNGNIQYLASVSGNNTTYECIGLPTNHQYKFIVRAVNTNGSITASSSICSVTNYTAEATNDFCYLRHVSVIDNEYVEVQVLTDGANTPFTGLNIFKSVNNNQNFSKIATIAYQSGLSNYTYEDHNADVNGSLNYYKVTLLNECGIESAASNIAHTILLKGEGTAAQENALQWNNYGEFNGGTESYSVFRKVEISPYFVDVETNLPASELNNYSDNVSDLFEMGSHFKYYVVAKEGLNEYGFSDESVSNIVEVEQFPNTYIPNAFCPKSTILENQVFKPANSFMSTIGYLFIIYSRQGEIVFMTNDITQGWDGTEQKNGKAVPPGMYVYRLEYLKPDGDKVVKNGTVMVVY